MDPAAQAELLAQLQDGEFWVDEQEFLREFDEVTIGYPVTEHGHLRSLYSGSPARRPPALGLLRGGPRLPRARRPCGAPTSVCAPALEKLLCHAQALPGAWVQGQSAGGCRNHSGFPSNPKFWLRVSEPSEVCAAVLQRPRARTTGDGRAACSLPRAPGRDFPAVGLHLWKVSRGAGSPLSAGREAPESRELQRWGARDRREPHELSWGPVPSAQGVVPWPQGSRPSPSWERGLRAPPSSGPSRGTSGGPVTLPAPPGPSPPRGEVTF